jgi:hypothetical protein
MMAQPDPAGVSVQGNHINTCGMDCSLNPTECLPNVHEATLGLYGHAIGYVYGGGVATVTVRVH